VPDLTILQQIDLELNRLVERNARKTVNLRRYERMCRRRRAAARPMQSRAERRKHLQRPQPRPQWGDHKTVSSFLGISLWDFFLPARHPTPRTTKPPKVLFEQIGRYRFRQVRNPNLVERKRPAGHRARGQS
jgi:hypothetical protein